jgi:L-threonylcarbamoyladenylate synthase
VPRVSSSLMDAVPVLKRGGLAVIPTDTIYGLVASALDPTAVQRLYAVRRRDLAKPCIILVSQMSDLAQFDLKLTATNEATLASYWPGPVSVALPCQSTRWDYLHRGSMSLALRVPAPAALRAFLAATGPLLAPSANPEGAAPAITVAEAQAYFGDQVDSYIDGGERQGKPSRLIKMGAAATTETLRP